MTPEQIKNIEVYFTQFITPEEFAVTMRCFIRAAVTYYIDDEDMTWQKEMQDGYFQLTEFLEQIDPVMEGKK